MNNIPKEISAVKDPNSGADWFPRPQPEPVFYDRLRRRARIVGGAVLLFVIVAVVWFFEFFTRLDDLPPLSDMAGLTGQIDAALQISPPEIRALQDGIATRCGQSALRPDRDNNVVSAFLPFGDLTAMSAARAGCRDLRDLYYEAWRIDTFTGRLIANAPDAHAYPFDEYRVGWNAWNRPNGYPVITLPAQVPGQDLQALLLGKAPDGFAAQIGQLPLERIQNGICLDLSAHPQLSSDAVMAALQAISTAVAPYQKATCLLADVNLPALANPAIMGQADLVVAKVSLVDPVNGGPAGSVAATQAAIARVRANVPNGKLHIALATQGVALSSGQRRGRPVSFVEAMFLAGRYDASISFAAESGLHLMRYVDEAGAFHRIWLPSADVLRMLVRGGGGTEPVVLWPVGYEDPTLWAVQATQDDRPISGEIVSEIATYGVFDGDGPFSTAISAATAGLRMVETENGRVVSAAMKSVPTANHIRYFGAAPELNTLSLSFSGLVGGAEMDRLIELLQRLEIPATFFLSFQDQLAAGDTISTLLENGHQVGIELVPQRAMSGFAYREADLRNKLLQHFLAHQHGLRARFILDPGTLPEVTANLALLMQVQDLQRNGYAVVHPTVATPIGAMTAGQLVELIYGHALVRSTNVVTFDISGLSRRQLDEDLTELLMQLKADGFSFFSLPELADIPPHEAVPEATIERLQRDDVTYAVMTFSWASIQGVILLLALIVALRSPAYLLLAMFRRKRYPLDMDFHPPLTLLIPAYNEEKVIRRTLESALNVDYPDLKIIVVDDGSTDATREIVRDIVSRTDKIRLVVQENEGKWSALDHAVAVTDTPFIAILDADSLIDPMALREIVQPFKDDGVGGVAGTVEIGNKDGILTIFQRLEYLHTQQVMRRAYEVFDGIIVVPGAMGAWRVDAVRAAGLISGDTITEDADLTIAVHRSGYRIRYQENATSFTEAPTKITSFRNQRFRWTFGMFQASWKHKRAILEGKPVGFISIIDAIWYQLVTSVIYPFFDVYFLILFSQMAFSYVTRGDAGDVAFSPQITTAYLLIITFEFLNILAAMGFARKFEFKLLLAGPLSRFGYRQLLYLASIKAIYAAIVGKLAAWNKLERLGTARFDVEPVRPAEHLTSYEAMGDGGAKGISYPPKSTM